MSNEPSAVGALIAMLTLSVTFGAILYFLVNPIWAVVITVIWIVFFVSVLTYDRRHWGQPKMETLGINLSSKTRILPNGTYKVEGMVMGTCVKTRNIFSSARAELRSLVGGEASQFTGLVDECRNIALTRMCKKAKDKKCNWIVGFRMITAETMWGTTEFIAYGTAIKVS
jgi:uncharacterized protein YbjQ (UPF0145 family)